MAFTLAVEVVGKKEQFYGVPWSMTIFSIREAFKKQTGNSLVF